MNNKTGYKEFLGEYMSSNIDSAYFIEKYINLCAQMCKKPEDYTKEKVKKHNKAMRELAALKKTISANSLLSEEVYGTLLDNEDLYVKQSAATDCLKLSIHLKVSVQILKWISRHGDRMSSMGAKRNLLIWKGKLDPREPY